MSRLKLSVILRAVLLAAGLCFSQDLAAQRTGILGAFPEEVELLKSEIQNQSVETILGVEFVAGELNGRQVVLARSGIGKTNAAVTTILLIEHFRPSEVVFTGIAGSANPELLPGDIVLGKSTTQHDNGMWGAVGFLHLPTRGIARQRVNPLYFPADETLLRLAERAAENLQGLQGIEGTEGVRQPRIVTGVIVTGDAFVASKAKTEELRKRHDADAIEMEGAAVAQVCFEQNVPCLIVRSLSDSADSAAIADVQKFEEAAANNSARLVMALIALLQED